MSQIDDLLTSIAACLCAQIEEDDLPEPCFCGVMPGELVALDYVGACRGKKDGMAWTRLTMSYPASGVGVPNQTIKNCSGGFGIEIEMGVMRSAPTMDKKGEPPNAEQQAASSRLQIADMLAMYKAVACCPLLQDYDWIMSQYRPVGPTGFAIGGTFTVMVAI